MTVCDFAVPNEILVTRRHGQVAIQGNTKHGAHLVRLLRMAREILEGKGVIVRRLDADELRTIRFEGAWPFERLIEWAQAQDEELEVLKKISPLPREPDRRRINEVCVQVIEEMR